jgi:hypothetical protein
MYGTSVVAVAVAVAVSEAVGRGIASPLLWPCVPTRVSDLFVYPTPSCAQHPSAGRPPRPDYMNYEHLFNVRTATAPAHRLPTCVAHASSTSFVHEHNAGADVAPFTTQALEGVSPGRPRMLIRPSGTFVCVCVCVSIISNRARRRVPSARATRVSRGRGKTAHAQKGLSEEKGGGMV